MGQRMKLDFKPELVDREEEFSELKDYFEKAKEGEGSTVFVAGEAGIGKTRLVSELLDFVKTEDDDLSIISGRCLSDSLEPLMPIREGLHEAGLSHLVSHRPPPKVLSAYLIDDAGMLIAKAERKDTDLDHDVFSSMLSLVQNFVKDSLSMMGRKEKGELNTVGYGDYSILIRSLEGVSLATVIEGTKSELLIDDMKEKLSGQLERISEEEDKVSDLDDVTKDLEWFIESGKYDGEHLVDEPELKKENLFENVLLGFQRLSEDETVVLFLDDLQWADPSTLSLLHYLARNTTDEKVLILGTYRPEDITETSDGESHQLVSPKREMKREGLLEEIKLERLTEKDVEDFIQEVLGECDFEKDFLRRIYKESEGNPLFLLELTKMLVEEGHIQKKESVWKLIEPLDEVHIPERVYEMVSKRLEVMVKEQRDLLEYASVIGEEFKGEIVAEASGQDRVKVLKDLDRIENTYGLVRSLGKKYRFDHSKIREVLYNGMNESLRNMYHQVVAESYETLYDDRIEEVIEDVAQHYYKAEDERAGEYLLKAAELAKERYANDEAERFYEHAVEVSENDEELKDAYEGLGDVHRLIGEYEKALKEYDEVMDMLADTDEDPTYRSVKDTRDVGKKAEVLGKKAKVYENKGEFDESLECCERGLDLVERGDEEAEKRKLELLGAKGWALLRIGEYDDAEETWKKAVEMAEKVGEEKEEAQAVHDLGSVYWSQGEYDRALELWGEALTIRKDIGDEKGLGDSLNNIAIVYHDKGELDRALEQYEESLEIARKIGEKQGMATSLGNMGDLYHDKGELDRALEHHEDSLEIRRNIGDKQGIADSLIGIGIMYRYEGRLEKAREKLKESLEICTEIGDRFRKVENKLESSEICIEEERYDKALRTAEEALKISQEIGAEQEEGKSRRVLGKIYREKGELEKAEEELERAREVFEESGIALELPKVKYEKGILLKKKGDQEKAEEYLSEALKAFEDIGMKLWIEMCVEALEDLQDT